MDYPEYAVVNGKEYKINTDFRIAIKCSEIIEDNTIDDYERSLAIIYLLFGKEGLKAKKDHVLLLKVAEKFLSCGIDNLERTDDVPDMDYQQDKDLIQSSFKYDYQYNPYALDYLHWYEFFNDLNNLSNSEFGDCCILNRVRNLRNTDTSKIADDKERQSIEKAKKRFELKKYKKENNLTEKELKSMEELNKIIGI